MALDVINYKMHSKIEGMPWLNLNDRKYAVPTMESVWRFKTILDGSWVNNFQQEAISFKVPCAMKLYGIGSFLTNAEPSTVDIKVYNGSTLLYSGSNLPLVKNDSIYAGDVLLAKPVRLSTGKTYTVIEVSAACKVHYSNTGLEKVDCKGGTITFISSSMNSYSTAKKGQIPLLIIGS
ncbi:uncharacterized protein LOC110451976 [Mizuhopecten yessoensis]|nr:uncharacterized protein LOC110451976 [Mizuhopecten yessoensis]